MLRRPSQPLRPDIPGTTTTTSLGSYDLYANRTYLSTSHWLSLRYIVHWISSQTKVVLAAVFESAAGIRYTPLTIISLLHRIKGRVDIHSFLLIHRQKHVLFLVLGILSFPDCTLAIHSQQSTDRGPLKRGANASNSFQWEVCPIQFNSWQAAGDKQTPSPCLRKTI